MGQGGWLHPRSSNPPKECSQKGCTFNKGGKGPWSRGRNFSVRRGPPNPEVRQEADPQSLPVQCPKPAPMLCFRRVLPAPEARRGSKKKVVKI